MRDYITTVSKEVVNKLISLALLNDIGLDMFDGTLQDNAIIYNDRQIRIKGIRPSKYIILREKFRNIWSSDIEMILTDNDQLVDDYLEVFEGGV